MAEDLESIWHTDTRTSICAPSVRMMAIHAIRIEGEALPELETNPVVALAVQRREVWLKEDQPTGTSRPRPDCPSHLLRRSGYRLYSVENVTTALIVDCQYGLVEYDSDLLILEGAALVACPWPESEDAERMRPHYERLAETVGFRPSRGRGL